MLIFPVYLNLNSLEHLTVTIVHISFLDQKPIGFQQSILFTTLEISLSFSNNSEYLIAVQLRFILAVVLVACA